MPESVKYRVATTESLKETHIFTYVPQNSLFIVGRSVGFGRKQILEVLVFVCHKRFAADDAGIRDITDGDTESLKETHIFTYVPPNHSIFLATS